MRRELPASRKTVRIAVASLAGISATAILIAAMALVTGRPVSNSASSSSQPRPRPSSLAAGPDVDLDTLIRTSPTKALRIAEQLDASPQRDDLIRRAVAEWSLRDGKGAMRWVLESAEPGLRDELRSIALVHLADHDPAAATEIFTRLPPSVARTQALASLYQRWAERDPDTARTSATELPDPHERIRALEQVARQLASDDPSKAIRMVIDESIEESTPDLLEELASRWAVSDHTAAQEWLDLQPQGELRDRLMKQVAAVAAREDPRGAAKSVLEKIPAGMTQDEAILSVLNEWLLSDVNAASEWAATFPPGPLRSRADEEIRNAIRRGSPQ